MRTGSLFLLARYWPTILLVGLAATAAPIRGASAQSQDRLALTQRATWWRYPSKAELANRTRDVLPTIEADVPEIEPNNSAAAATAASIGDRVTGSISPVGDVDYYVVTVPAGTFLELEVEASRVGSFLDATLQLFDRDGVTSLEFNDDAGSLDSRIRFQIESEGDYFFAIRDLGGGGGSSYFYSVDISAIPPPPGNPITTFASGFQVPIALAFDSVGNLFVADVAMGRITRVAPDGSSSLFQNFVQGGDWMTFDAFGNLIVPSWDGTLQIITDTEIDTLSIGINPGPIALGPDGGLWMGSWDMMTGFPILSHRDPYGGLIEAFLLPVSPAALAFAPSGELYMMGFDNSLMKLSNGVVETLVTGSFENCCFTGMALDEDGNLYVANGFLGEVSLYGPDGTLLEEVFAFMDAGTPSTLAFGRDANGMGTARLFASSATFGLYQAEGRVVEFNPAAIRAPGHVVDVGALLRITKNRLRGGVIGQEYADTLTAADPAVTWSIAAGTLPPGLSLDGVTGVVSGVPMESGAFRFQARAESQSLAGERAYELVIEEPVLSTTDVIDELLGVGLLSPSELLYLDLIGNRNDEFDIGDVRAFLQRMGTVNSPEVLRD
jgi:sugar lactone lactonase YvrE